jgi:GH15 family glucan-1,4-alpha-glucosidase
VSRHPSAAGSWEPPPIREYGLLGDTRTAALTSLAGSIDWMCWPRFDSRPVFGRLIDNESGGWFEITVQGATRRTRKRSSMASKTGS